VPRHAAEREMHEELGRRIEDWISLGELFVNSNHHDDNLHLFQARVQDRELDLNLTELAEADWFPRDALPAELSRHVRTIVSRVSGA
jgi:8-oxo-dGTP pyrophosphatase MutT (NUDIX family)